MIDKKRTTLTRAPAPPPQGRPPTLRFLLDNLGWLIVSVLTASVIWYVAVSAQNPVEQRRLSERLRIEYDKSDELLFVITPPETAQVTVRAPKSVWEVLSPEEIHVIADLSKCESNKICTVELRGTLSPARQGTVTDIQPSQIQVELAPRKEKKVTIEVIRTAEPPPGLESTPTLSDQEALITGPESKVDQVVGAQARVSLQDRRARFQQLVRVIPVDTNNNEVTGVTVAPTEVTVTIDIQPRADVTELTIIPRLIGELPAGYRRINYTPSPQSVPVRGDRTVIEGLNGLIPTEPIDLTGQTETFTQAVKLVLPPGVTLVDPVNVTVKVEIEPILGSREFDNVPVVPQGLDPADYTITVQPDRVNVIVNGPQPVLDAMTGADISVIAPLSGLSAGKYPVTLKASVTKPGINPGDIVIPNARAEVTIVARNPTVTPTGGATRTPTSTPPPTAEPTPTSTVTP
jgi:YbbR domain-containing protein